MKDYHRRRSFLPWGWGVYLSILILFVFSGFSLFAFRALYTGGSQPVLVSKVNIPPLKAVSGEVSDSPAISIRETVYFPDEVLVFLKYPPSTAFLTKDAINCVYLEPNTKQPEQELSPLSVEDQYDKNHQIVHCPLPTSGTIVSVAVGQNAYLTPGRNYEFDSLAYEAIIDRDNSTIVFLKGLKLDQAKPADPSKFKCLYGWDLSNPKLVLSADVVSVAQEIVRCKTPLSILNNPEKFSSRGGVDDSIKVTVRLVGKRTIRSVARLRHPLSLSDDKKVDMCVCTMLRNQARFLPEWIMYHKSIGVDRWFLYDNNSDDDIEQVIESLVSANYDVSRHVWPWIKTQEASFAHCGLRARDSCEWVGFIDVDEFLYLPSKLSLTDVLRKKSGAGEIGELRVSCNDFGPSGLREIPTKGVMAGYTCRMKKSERHKSLVKPEALSASLINVIHHFELKSGFRHENMKVSDFVINHYKYPVWEVFKEKFVRRAATYVSDWHEETKMHSNDRAPGLGTEAIEPSDWSTRFCQVRDTGLRDLVLETFARPSGLLPWEDHTD